MVFLAFFVNFAKYSLPLLMLFSTRSFHKVYAVERVYSAHAKRSVEKAF